MTQPTLDQIRIAELIEIEAFDDLYDAGTALGTDLGARHHRAGMVSYYAVDVDRGNTNMNRLRGVALEASRAVDLVAEAEQFFQPGTHYSVTIAPTTHAADVEAGLRSRDCRLGPAVVKLRHSAPRRRRFRCEFEIKEIGAALADEFGAVWAASLPAPPAFGEWIATLAGRPRWHCFLALDRRSAVACGALFVGMSGRTWLGFAATLESFRGHGAQSALLSTRLERAAALGSPETYAETSADDGSGDRNPSLQNLERAGFTRFYRREMYLATS